MNKKQFNINIYKNIIDLREVWITILNNNTDLSYYQSYEWNNTIDKTYKKSLYKRLNFKIRYAYWKNSDNKKIIFPMAINNKEKKIYFLGHISPSDYLNFIYTDDVDEHDFGEFIGELKIIYKNYELILNNINENTRTNKILKSMENIIETQKTICVKIDIPNTYDEYYKNLKKQYREKINNSYNKLKKDNKQISFDYKLNRKIDDKLSKKLYDLYKKRQESKGRVSNICRILDYIYKLFNINKDEVTLAIQNCEKNFVAIAYIDGEIAAQLIGFIHGKIIVFPRIAMNPKFSKYRPGILLLSNTIKYLSENKEYEILDLTRGNEKYKYDYGGVEHYNYCFKI